MENGKMETCEIIILVQLTLVFVVGFTTSIEIMIIWFWFYKKNAIGLILIMATLYLALNIFYFTINFFLFEWGCFEILYLNKKLLIKKY